MLDRDLGGGDTLRFALLCDFLAGVSIAELAREYRLVDREIEAYLRKALFAYGFRSGP